MMQTIATTAASKPKQARTIEINLLSLEACPYWKTKNKAKAAKATKTQIFVVKTAPSALNYKFEA